MLAVKTQMSLSLTFSFVIYDIIHNDHDYNKVELNLYSAFKDTVYKFHFFISTSLSHVAQ